jgi:hypothetical protein
MGTDKVAFAGEQWEATGSDVLGSHVTFPLTFSPYFHVLVYTSKTKILIFNKTGRCIEQNFRYGNENIECVSNCKYLGIWFSSSGSY